MSHWSVGAIAVAVVILAVGSLTYAVKIGIHSAVSTAGSSTTSAGGSSTTTTPTTSPSPAQPTYQLLVEPQAGFGNIYALTNQAKHSIEMTMYELSDQTEEGALASAVKRGVDVRVILDQAFHGQSVNQAAYGYLQANHVQVKWAPAATIYHQKTITFDNALSMVGTGNLTSQYYSTSRDYWVADTNTSEINAIVGTFNTDWTSSSVTPGQPAGNLLWSPGAEGPLVNLINSAQTSVWFESEELSDQAIINALAGDAKRGIKCEVVMTDSTSWASAFSALRASGCQVHLYPNSPSTLYIHAKAIVIDAGTPNANLFVGSQNASSGSLNSNRELGILLSSKTAPSVVSGISSAFTSDFEGAPQT